MEYIFQPGNFGLYFRSILKPTWFSMQWKSMFLACMQKTSWHEKNRTSLFFNELNMKYANCNKLRGTTYTTLTSFTKKCFFFILLISSVPARRDLRTYCWTSKSTNSTCCETISRVSNILNPKQIINPVCLWFYSVCLNSTGPLLN